MFINATGDPSYVNVIGHGARNQHAKRQSISWSEAQPGDLVFYPDLGHVGIVAGEDDNGNLFYKVAYDILHNHQDAEDALQISLEIIYRYFYKIKDEIEKKCVGYMIVIIRNESIDLFNTRKKILVANEDVMDRKHFMQRENENGFLKNQELKEAIKKLDDKYRDIYILG